MGTIHLVKTGIIIVAARTKEFRITSIILVEWDLMQFGYPQFQKTIKGHITVITQLILHNIMINLARWMISKA